MSDRREARRQLGAVAVYTESEAVALLPCRDCVARAWLRESGLVRDHPQLGRIVVWGEVIAEIQAGDGPQESAPRPAARYPRAGLRRR